MALAPTAPLSIAPVDGSTRQSFARIPAVQPVPNLIQIQRDSFRWFLNEGLKELFAEISPISDFTGRNMELELAVTGPNGEPGYVFGDPKLSEEECRDRDTTFAAPLRVRPGQVLTIRGENFGAQPQDTSARFDGKPGRVIRASSDQIEV